jgi:peptidoglycan/LPS O-acetylase OafA/YrhL
MSLLPKSKAEGVEHLKRGMLILAAFGYLIFLSFGMDRGLGVFYRTPNYCWAALTCAVVAAACDSKRPRWLWGIAGVAAIAACLYAYHQNSEWPKRLERVQAQQASPSPSQSVTNR